MRYEFDILGKPVAKGSMQSLAYKDKTGRLRSRVFHSSQSKRWEKEIQDQIPEPTRLEGAISVELVFYLERPKSAKRPRPYVRPDIDKLARAILDALTGHFYADDSQVVRLVSEKYYADDRDVGVSVIVENI